MKISLWPDPPDGRAPLLLALVMAALRLVCTDVQAANLRVVASTPDLGALAEAVGTGRIELTTLARPTEDPHFADAKPSHIIRLNRADLLVEGGADLEAGWLPSLINQARNPKIRPGGSGHFSAADGIRLLEIPGVLDRSQGDIHASGNPHFLMDPANAGIVARRMAEAMSHIDPAAKAIYEQNLTNFLNTLEKKLVQWDQKLAPYKGQKLASYHNSWIYFGARFGLKTGLYLEPKPGVPPTPAHLAEVITTMKAGKVRAILVEVYLNRRIAETVAVRTGATVIDAAQFPGGVKGAGTGYIGLMDYLVNSVAAALESANP